MRGSVRTQVHLGTVKLDTSSTIPKSTCIIKEDATIEKSQLKISPLDPIFNLEFFIVRLLWSLWYWYVDQTDKELKIKQ